MSSLQIPTRERILEVTWRLMEQRRGQGVRIEEIAKAAGVSRQAVYLHFGTRSELLIETTRYVDEKLNFQERIQEVCQRGGGIVSLEDFAEVWGNYIPEIYGLAKALLDARDADEAAAAAWNDRMTALHDGCGTIIMGLEQCGQLATDWSVEEATDFLWAMISVRTWESLTIERGWTQAQYVERTQMALKRALLKMPRNP